MMDNLGVDIEKERLGPELLVWSPYFTTSGVLRLIYITAAFSISEIALLLADIDYTPRLPRNDPGTV